jgi:hypothetical protein
MPILTLDLRLPQSGQERLNAIQQALSIGTSAKTMSSEVIIRKSAQCPGFDFSHYFHVSKSSKLGNTCGA